MPHPRKSAHALEVTDSEPRWSERAPSEIAGGRAKLPPGLAKECRAHFKRISKLLGTRGHESPADGELIAAYARTYRDMLACRAIVEGEGRMISTTVLSSNGNPVVKRQPHPLLREIASCESRLAALLRDLGLTLTLRDRVKKPATAPPPVQELTEEQRKNLTLGERAALGDEGAIKILQMTEPKKWTS